MGTAATANRGRVSNGLPHAWVVVMIGPLPACRTVGGKQRMLEASATDGLAAALQKQHLHLPSHIACGALVSNVPRPANGSAPLPGHLAFNTEGPGRSGHPGWRSGRSRELQCRSQADGHAA